MKTEHWYERPDIQRYTLDHYSGAIGRGTRVFAWVQDGKVVHGNAAAFAIHLGQRFGFTPHRSATIEIHAILRASGLRARAEFTRTERGRRHGLGYVPEPVIVPEHETPIRVAPTLGHRHRHAHPTEGRVVKGRLVQGADGIWREEEE